MTAFTNVFGGTTILPSQPTYVALAPTGDFTLAWPKETQPSPNLIATTIEVNAGALAVNGTLPDATLGSTGVQLLFANLGSDTITIKDSAGNVVLTIASGLAWVLYLRDNSTAAGLWGSFQLGASVSQAQASLLAGSGLVAVANTLAKDVPSINFSATPTNFVLSDRARLYRWTGGAGVGNLPSSGTVPVGWCMKLRNDGSGTLTVNATGGDTINGSASISLQQGQSCEVVCAAAGIMCTIGLGQSSTSSFDYTSIAVPGNGTYVLSGSELNRISYKFTGILTGDRTIEVPATVQQYWVDNSTTGAFNFYVKTAAQAAPGVQVSSGQRAILYCDSNNVLDADTAGISTPISIANGGTGATTASGARTNLGSTGVGDALFTAASAAAARATIDAASLTQTNTFTAANTFSSNSAGAGINPVITLDRNKGAAGSANDFLGQLKFAGRNGANAFFEFGSITAQILDATAGSEDGRIPVFTPVAGVSDVRVYVGAGLYSKSRLDKGAETLNFTTLYESDTALSAKYLAISLLTTNGDIIIRSAGVPARLGVGSANQVLTVSGGLPSWQTPAAVPTVTKYDSGDQAITSGGTITLNHGLGSTPDVVLVYLHCATAEAGYSIGDFILAPVGMTSNGRGLAIRVSSSQIKIFIGANGSAMDIIDTSGNSFNITNADWKLVARAVRFS